MNKALKLLVLFGISISSMTLYSCNYAAEKLGDCILLDACPKSRISPEQTVENYYQLINSRKYPEAWVMLSPRFQKSVSNDNYREYEKWWNGANLVKIVSVALVRKNENVAIVNADLIYKMKDGKEIQDSKREIILVLDSNGRWLIERKQ